MSTLDTNLPIAKQLNKFQYLNMGGLTVRAITEMTPGQWVAMLDAEWAHTWSRAEIVMGVCALIINKMLRHEPEYRGNYAELERWHAGFGHDIEMLKEYARTVCVERVIVNADTQTFMGNLIFASFYGDEEECASGHKLTRGIRYLG